MKIFLLAVIMFLSACSKASESQESSNGLSSAESTTSSIQNQLNRFQPSVPIRKISSLNIPTFLDVYTSFLENQIVWLRSSETQSAGGPVAVESEETLNKDAQSVLDAQAKQKVEFFKKWGITFDDFDQFSLTHSQAIQDYLSSHPAEQKRIEDLDRFLSSIQNSSASQNDEYNYKDENSIIDHTTMQEESSAELPDNSSENVDEGNAVVSSESKGSS